MEGSRQIEERAAEWLLRRESAGWSEADEARLDEWLSVSTLNRVAFLRLEAGWKQADRLKAVGVGFPRGRVPGEAELLSEADESMSRAPPGDAESAPASGMWLKLRFPALAATLLGLLAGGALIFPESPWSGDRYATPVGGVASVPLKDGSSVTLNTASRIRVRMSDEERRVDLAQGEAFFDVVRDPARPFIVRAGSRRIVVLGTKFSVRRDGDDVRVVVTEGAVRIERTGSGAGELPRLAAGAVASVTPARVSVQSRPLPETEELLSWRSGYVVFHETALAEAAAEFNRYNDRKIVVRDSQISRIRLSGKFRATNFDAFVRLLESTSPVRAEYSPAEILLTPAEQALHPQ